MDKNNFFKKDALRPTEEQHLLTKPFYKNANAIYQHFNAWNSSSSNAPSAPGPYFPTATFVSIRSRTEMVVLVVALYCKLPKNE